MSDAVVVALISGIISLCGIVLTAFIQSRKITADMDKQSSLADARLEKAQAVTDTKIDALASNVQSMNEVLQRIPALEERVRSVKQHVDDLERKVNK